MKATISYMQIEAENSEGNPVIATYNVVLGGNQLTLTMQAQNGEPIELCLPDSLEAPRRETFHGTLVLKPQADLE